jgi:amidohydrolase
MSTTVKEFLKECNFEKIVKSCIALRHDIHQHPELGFKEKRTSSLIARELHKLGLSVYEHIGETGVIAHLRCSKDGPVLAFRADIDALPIEEKTGVKYASLYKGVHHACGHDGHVAILLGTAMLLTQLKHKLRGTIKFIFQPAEEVVGGAQPIVAHKMWRTPLPDMIVALHGWPSLPLGMVEINYGVTYASAGRFRITIKGRGGHGSAPELTHDPVATMIQCISAIQNIKSREISALTPVVISVCQINAGSASNIIPDTATFAGTVRALSTAKVIQTIRRIHSLSSQIAKAMKCEATLDEYSIVPPCVNKYGITKRVENSLRKVFDKNIKISYKPSMGAEDFVYFTQSVPGVYFRLGLGPYVSNVHSAQFDFNDEAIPYGIQAFGQIALDFLEIKKSTR